MILRALPTLRVDPGGVRGLNRPRRLARVFGEGFPGRPLRHVELVVARLVEDELVDARLHIWLENAEEGVSGSPRIGVRLRDPVVQRAIQGVGVAPRLAAVDV